MRKKRVVLVKDFTRHAIDAAEVASISDRNAQVAQLARETVSESPVRRRGEPRNIGNGRDIGDGNDASRHDRFGFAQSAAASLCNGVTDVRDGSAASRDLQLTMLADARRKGVSPLPFAQVLLRHCAVPEQKKRHGPKSRGAFQS
jgi:hypothetical protein